LIVLLFIVAVWSIAQEKQFVQTSPYPLLIILCSKPYVISGLNVIIE